MGNSYTNLGERSEEFLTGSGEYSNDGTWHLIGFNGNNDGGNSKSLKIKFWKECGTLMYKRVVCYMGNEKEVTKGKAHVDGDCITLDMCGDPVKFKVLHSDRDNYYMMTAHDCNCQDDNPLWILSKHRTVLEHHSTHLRDIAKSLNYDNMYCHDHCEMADPLYC